MDQPFLTPFTFSMATEAGISRRGLQRLLAEDVVRRSVRGVYVPTSLPDDVGTRAQSLRLVTPSDCVVVDRHAGWLLGAQMVLAPNEHLELRPLSLYRRSGGGRLRNEMSRSGERNLTDIDIIEVAGLQVTTALRTAWDLGRVRWTDEAISGMDAMLRLGTFSREELLDGVERFRRMRWVTTLRAIAPLADGRSESPGESVLRLRCHECLLDGMVPQVEVRRRSALVARLDLGDEETETGVEYDGEEWHSSPEQKKHDTERRDDARGEGWLIEAYTKANVFGRHRDIEARLHALRLKAESRRRRTA